ncbi:MAG: hypothetical protein IKK18_05970 [Clostridia bacterium]|nr:hypothetical protein [Clostridia bacterium]
MGYLVLGVVSLVICFIAALEFSAIASKKGYDDAKYFCYPFLLGIIGMLIVIALPDRGDKYNVVSVNNNKKNSLDYQNIEKKVDIAHSDNKENEKEEIEINTYVENEKYIPLKAILRDSQKVCPSCGKVQNTDRKKCWDCGQIFEE